MISQNEILNFLKTKSSGLGLINKLKVIYRPLICPFDVLLNYVKPNESTYDIGCGSGQFCSLIAKFTDAKKIFGIEISENLIENAILLNQEFKTKKKMHFNTFDGKIIPLEIKNFSLIYLIDVLHHVPKFQQETFFKEIYSKMAINSKLVFKDIDAESNFVVFNKIHDLIFSKEIGNEIGFNQAKILTQKTGFKLVDCFKKRMFVYPHYFLILEK